MISIQTHTHTHRHTENGTRRIQNSSLSFCSFGRQPFLQPFLRFVRQAQAGAIETKNTIIFNFSHFPLWSGRLQPQTMFTKVLHRVSFIYSFAIAVLTFQTIQSAALNLNGANEFCLRCIRYIRNIFRHPQAHVLEQSSRSVRQFRAVAFAAIGKTMP